ncbi:membrane protein [Actinoplanes lobatus]|uniref:Membrane protein n=1 Tax=Actinoplanes lobatus TaxID=113568 RepID=A0A7W7H9C1_9ACTN|nr:VTT domain-containing protein [Actinoplanes lobatus]MBB4746258.1 membrane protein DedA with SNARE-associated domain [Actinoplanes lobatus]GGN61058.1 membrane protein [Actinoplanes lobatus]GIE41148.1 membrane protein [Actinoplanes lobatus]
MIDTLGALGWLFLVVAFGAIVPVVPTGAAVSSAAAYALHEHPYAIGLVVAAGAAGAYTGDLVMYAMCRYGGEQLARRLHWLNDEERLNTVRARLQRRQVTVLLVSRLVPGGRVPVLLAAAFAGVSWRTFVIANLPACVLWSLVYTTIGLLGASIFPEPWQGVLAAIVVILVVNQSITWISRWWDRRAARASTSSTS